MVDLEIVAAYGTSPERLRQIFTQQPVSATDNLEPEERSRQTRDFTTRSKIQDVILRNLFEQINFSLKNHHLYSAPDLAWDGPPINKAIYPMMLYAQGMLDLGGCAEQLKGLPGCDRYATKDDKGNIVGIDLPKFVDVNVNLVRSFITRRLAAQSNRYSNLWPLYKFEARSTSLPAKLRADVMSQLLDVMADNYGYREHDVQVFRDTMLYGHCLSFPRAAWEREIHWRKKKSADVFTAGNEPMPEAQDGGEPTNPATGMSVTAVPGEKMPVEPYTVKEGVCFANPHPSRVFWDNAYPMSSLNSDTGCTYVGYWDVIRFGDIFDNPAYWNRALISYSSNTVSLFTTYAQYFATNLCTLAPPWQGGGGGGGACSSNADGGGSPRCATGGYGAANDLSSENDRKNNTGLYAVNQPNSAMIVTNYFRKLKPLEWGLGDYPYEVWMRFVVAGESTVIYAEVLPSTPALYCGYNENDSRQVNISMAHELMSYQDHMTNLLSYLLMCIKSDAHKILLCNADVIEPEHMKQLRAECKARNSSTDVIMLEYSAKKMEGLGINVQHVMQMVETAPSQAINVIFRAMAELVQLVERLMAMSPQEQGQPAPREISATETNLIAGTTESVFSFISDAFDTYRAAKKKMLYESYLACGNQNFRVPVMWRYSDKTIQQAGFEVDPDEAEEFADDRAGTTTKTARHTVIGTKDQLEETYIFTTRDGAERAANTQASQTMVQLLSTIQNPVVLQALGKEKLFEIINEIWRLSGAGFDLGLKLNEGESNEIDPNQGKEMQDAVQKLAQGGQQIQQQLQNVTQLVSAIVAKLQQVGIIPPPQQDPNAGGQPPQGMPGMQAPPGPQMPPQVVPMRSAA